MMEAKENFMKRAIEDTKLDVVEGFLRKECLKLFDIRRTEH